MGDFDQYYGDKRPAKPVAATDPMDALHAAAKVAAPNIHDYFFADRKPPPTVPPNYTGKVSGYDDPYAGKAALEALALGAGGLETGLGGRIFNAIEPQVARGGTTMLGKLAQRLRPQAADSEMLMLAGLNQGMRSTPAEAAGARLTPDQRRQMEMERQRQEASVGADRQRGENDAAIERQRAQAAADMERQRGESSAAMEVRRAQMAREQQDADAASGLQRKENERLAAKKVSDQEAGRPLVDKYPGLFAALPYIGGAISARIPWKYNSRQNARHTDTINSWNATADTAEAVRAAAAPNKGKISAPKQDAWRAGVKDLEGFRDEYPAAKAGYEKGMSPAALALSATLPLDATLAPRGLDLMFQGSGTEANKKAKEFFTSPDEIGPALGESALIGASGAVLGNKMSHSLPATPVGRGKGIIDSYYAKFPKEAPGAP